MKKKMRIDRMRQSTNDNNKKKPNVTPTAADRPTASAIVIVWWPWNRLRLSHSPLHIIIIILAHHIRTGHHDGNAGRGKTCIRWAPPSAYTQTRCVCALPNRWREYMGEKKKKTNTQYRWMDGWTRTDRLRVHTHEIDINYEGWPDRHI